MHVQKRQHNFILYMHELDTLLNLIITFQLDAQPTSMLTYKGDILLSIRYVPADKVKVTEYKGKSPKKEAGPGKGQLHVVVKEARNLTAVRSNGFSDPFCKG